MGAYPGHYDKVHPYVLVFKQQGFYRMHVGMRLVCYPDYSYLFTYYDLMVARSPI